MVRGTWWRVRVCFAFLLLALLGGGVSRALALDPCLYEVFNAEHHADESGLALKWDHLFYVRSVHDLQLHFFSHRIRVGRVGMAIKAALPALVKIMPEAHLERLKVELGLPQEWAAARIVGWIQQINDESVAHFLKRHDRAKTLRLDKLKEYGYQGERTILARLALSYAEVGGDRNTLMQLVADLNRVDHEIGDRALRDFNWENHGEGKLVQMIEVLADLFDRAFEAITAEEYGVASKGDIRTWFTQPKDALKAYMIAHLDHLWAPNTHGDHFVETYMRDLEHRGLLPDAPKDPTAKMQHFLTHRNELAEKKRQAGLH